MKVFWGSVIVAVVITIVAWALLGLVGMSAQDVYSSASVRL